MITSVKDAKAKAKIYNAIKTDKERLAFLKENRDSFKVVLDNDQTMVCFNIIGVEDEVQEEAISDLERELNTFDNYHGCTTGCLELFEFAGISAEEC